MNTLFVLLDGAEDDPVPEFGGKKPLDVAKMPFMASKAPHRAYTTGRGYTHLFLNEFFDLVSCVVFGVPVRVAYGCFLSINYLGEAFLFFGGRAFAEVDRFA